MVGVVGVFGCWEQDVRRAFVCFILYVSYPPWLRWWRSSRRRHGNKNLQQAGEKSFKEGFFQLKVFSLIFMIFDRLDHLKGPIFFMFSLELRNLTNIGFKRTKRFMILG